MIQVAIKIHFMYLNFARIYRSLDVPPAMAARVAEQLWELDDIVKPGEWSDMRDQKHQYKELTVTELARAAHLPGHRGKAAWRALKRFEELKDTGKHPRILHSESNRYLVLEPTDEPKT